eukprot:scaffold485923_cov37-Prasinocladus_malaysianus.AAC.1
MFSFVWQPKANQQAIHIQEVITQRDSKEWHILASGAHVSCLGYPEVCNTITLHSIMSHDILEQRGTDQGLAITAH